MATAKAQIALTAQTAAFNAAMVATEKVLDKLRTKMAGVTQAARIMLTGQTLALGGAVKLASDFEESFSKFENVFKEQADAAESWATRTGVALNRSKADLLGYLAGLQDLFVPLGFGREQARQLSQQLTQLAIDVASFNNEAESDVINNFTSALVGNHEAVRRFGIIITEASLNQRLMAQGITKGTQEATEQQKVMARLGIIMGSTADAQGDAARTADSFANQLKGLKAAVTDVVREVGGALLPAATQFVAILREIVVPMSAILAENQTLVASIALTAVGINAATIAFSAFLTVLKGGLIVLRAAGIAFVSLHTSMLAIKALGFANVMAAIKASALAALGGIKALSLAMLSVATSPIVLTLTAITAAFAGVILELRRANKEFDDFLERTTRLADINRTQFGVTSSQSATPFDDASTAKMKSEMEATTARVRETTNELEIAKKKLEELDSVFKSGFGITEDFKRMRDGIEANIAQQERLITKYNEQLNQLDENIKKQREINRIAAEQSQVGPFPADGIEDDAFKKLTDGLRERVAVFGQTEQAAQRVRLQLQGATEDQIALAEAMLATAIQQERAAAFDEEIARNKKEATDAIRSQTEALEDQAEAAARQLESSLTGINEEDLRLMELAKSANAEIARIAKEILETRRSIRDIESDRNASREKQAEAEAEKRKGEILTQTLKTKEEIAKADREEADRLLKNGEITIETHRRALEAIQERNKEQAKSFTGIETVSQALRRISESAASREQNDAKRAADAAQQNVKATNGVWNSIKEQTAKLSDKLDVVAGKLGDPRFRLA